MSAPGDKERDSLFYSNVDRLSELAARAVMILEKNPAEVAVVAIDVDDPEWTHLVRELMPGTNWDTFRDQGLMPVARGSVGWGTVEYICFVCPDVNGLLEREATPGHLYALVLARGGVSVYEVSYAGDQA